MSQLVDSPVSFLLIRQGEGVIESSEEDIFNEKYIQRVYKAPGVYKVMERKDHGDYSTSSRLRVVEFREYNADDKKKRDIIDEMTPPSPPSPPKPSRPLLPPSEFSIVRKAGGNTLRIIDNQGQVVHDNFTLDQLKAVKESYSGGPGIAKKDLKDQSFIQYAIVFLGGLAIGALATYLILNEKHSKEMSGLQLQLRAIQDQMKQMNAPRAQRKVSMDQFLMEEFNRDSGGPSLS